MPNDLHIVVVPKDLYYHEVAYVRALEALFMKGQEVIEAMQNDILLAYDLEKEYDALRKEFLASFLGKIGT